MAATHNKWNMDIVNNSVGVLWKSLQNWNIWYSNRIQDKMSKLEYFRGGGKISLVFWNSCSCGCWRSTQQSCKFSGFKDIFIRQNILMFTNFLILILMSWIITNYNILPGWLSGASESSHQWSGHLCQELQRRGWTIQVSHNLNLKVKSYSEEVGQYRFFLFYNHQWAGKCIHYGLLQHNLIT